jgi:hypothetical protein
MVLNEKGILKRFNLVVYPIDFVVAIGKVEEEVNKYFSPNNEAANWIVTPSDGTAGSTYCVHDKEDNQLCVMVWIRNLDECKGSTFAHECGHGALEIFNYIGATINPDEEQECFCYLLGTLFRLLNGAFYEYRDYKPKKGKKK